jgi:hypothetical protein
MNITKIIREEIQRFSEGMADTYAEKRFGIPSDTKGREELALSGIQDNSMGEYIGIIEDAKIYRNPENLNNFMPEVKALTDMEGNMYVAQNDYPIHGDIQKAIQASGKYSMTPAYHNFKDKLHLRRIGKTNTFGLGESYHGWAEHNQGIVMSLINAARARNPQYKFVAQAADDLQQSPATRY